MYIHTLCFELQLILDLVHVPFMMLDANGSIPHTQAQQHHSWATRNTFVIVTAIAIVTAVVIVMLSVTCIKDQACEPVQRLLERARGPCPRLPIRIPLFRPSGPGTALPPMPAHTLHTLDPCHCISCRGYHLGAASAHTRLARLQTS